MQQTCDAVKEKPSRTSNTWEKSQTYDDNGHHRFEREKLTHGV
jgi:hypothetical protein